MFAAGWMVPMFIGAVPFIIYAAWLHPGSFTVGLLLSIPVNYGLWKLFDRFG